MLDNKNDLVSYTESAMSSSNLSTVKSKNYALVKFEVICRTKEGQYVYVLGNTKELGCWQPENGLKMSTNKETYPLWSTTEEIKCNLNTEIYYKYVIIDSCAASSIVISIVFTFLKASNKSNNSLGILSSFICMLSSPCAIN